MCVAADSNVLLEMQSARLDSDDGSDGDVAVAIFAHTYLALDIEGHCLHEACDCVRGPFSDELKAWATQKENDGKIRRLPLKADPHFSKKLRQAGLPRKDWKWAALSRHDCVTHLLTEDVDFYDPALKDASGPAKEKIKNNRGGSIAKLMRKEAGAEVISIHHVSDFFPSE
jgi:hypothetical protein